SGGIFAQRQEHAAVWREVDVNWLRRIPKRRGLQNRRTAQPTMSEQHAFAKSSSVCRGVHFRGDSREVAVIAAIFGVQQQRHQPRFCLADLEAKLPGDVVSKRGGTHFRYRKAAGGNHQSRRAKLSRASRDHEAVRMAHFGDPGAKKNLYAGCATLRLQHSGNLIRRTIAEELAEG